MIKVAYYKDKTHIEIGSLLIELLRGGIYCVSYAAR